MIAGSSEKGVCEISVLGTLGIHEHLPILSVSSTFTNSKNRLGQFTMCLSSDEVNSPREIVPVVLHLLGEEPIPSHPHVVCKSRRSVAPHPGARTIGMQLSASSLSISAS
jgi:hypothetical protein